MGYFGICFSNINCNNCSLIIQVENDMNNIEDDEEEDGEENV